MLRAWTQFRDDYPQERRGLSFSPRAAASVENDRWVLAEEAAVAGFGPKGTESPLWHVEGLYGAPVARRFPENGLETGDLGDVVVQWWLTW